VDDGKATGMQDRNGVLMMQRMILAGTLGLAMARKAAAILEGEPDRAASPPAGPDGIGSQGVGCADSARGRPGQGAEKERATSGPEPRTADGAVLRAILDAANECLGQFDDRPAGERWCDTLFQVLDLAAFAAEFC
jgi:hypothetical protein